jgi:hypothetical protein
MRPCRLAPLSRLRPNAVVTAPLLGRALRTAALAAGEIRSPALRGFRGAQLCGAVVLLGLPWSLAGCLSGEGESCVSDVDCASDGECTRTGECVADGAAVRIVVRWTVAGDAPTPSEPGPCAAFGELEIRFHEPDGEPLAYRPVPCELGQAVYDKMPPRFQSVEVVAYDPAGDVVDSVEEPLAESGPSDLEFDLSPTPDVDSP